MARLTKTQKKRAVKTFLQKAKMMFLEGEITAKEYEQIQRTAKSALRKIG